MTGPFVYRREPALDGVGLAFTSAEWNLSDAQPPAARAEAFARLAGELGTAVAVVRQVHGADVVTVTSVSGELIDLTDQAADALVTAEHGLALAVRTADCVPVLFADPRAGLIGAAHAGRAGLLAGVLAATVDRLRAEGAAELTAWVGPHICGGCYEVPAELAAEFEAATGIPPARTAWGTAGIDLTAASARQLDDLGVRRRGPGGCTFTGQQLHSYRRDGASSGRMAGLIWLA